LGNIETFHKENNYKKLTVQMGYLKRIYTYTQALPQGLNNKSPSS